MHFCKLFTYSLVAAPHLNNEWFDLEPFVIKHL